MYIFGKFGIFSRSSKELMCRFSWRTYTPGESLHPSVVDSDRLDRSRLCMIKRLMDAAIMRREILGRPCMVAGAADAPGNSGSASVALRLAGTCMSAHPKVKLGPLTSNREGSGILVAPGSLGWEDCRERSLLEQLGSLTLRVETRQIQDGESMWV